MDRRSSRSSKSRSRRTASQRTSTIRYKDSNEEATRRYGASSDNTEATRVIKTVSGASKKPSKSRSRGKDKLKKSKAKKKKNKIWSIVKKLIIALIILGILAGLILAGIIAGIFLGFFGSDFKMTKEDLIIQFSNSEVYDADGNLLCYLNGNEQRKIVSLDKMPEYLPKAYVAIEDERFYEHPGVDIKRTGRATLTYLVHAGKSSFGGSTITQQLVKNITDEDEDSAMRKIKEMARAIQVEKEISKDNILELYLNIIFVGGNNINGVALGSEYYFNKDVSTLSLAECAFMAGINNQPNYYNPFNENNIDPATGTTKQSKLDEIKNRTKTVLGKMKELGYINDEQYEQAKAEADAGLAFNKGNLSTGVVYSAHLEAALNEIVEQMMKEKDMSRSMAETKVYGGGYKIYTTEVPAVQKAMENEVANAKYLNVNKNLSKGQSPQTAMVVIEPKTGKVVGCVGQMGTKTTNKELNRATQSSRQIGSAMKPIAVILPAVDLGIVNPSRVYDDTQTTEFTGKPWPKNYYGGFKGRMSVRDTIKISGNVIPVRILKEVTVEKSIEYLNKMGLYPNSNVGLPLALGAAEFTPLQMAGAYATIANDGEYIEPTFYNKVLDSEGNVVIEPNQKREQVIGRGEAYIVKSVTMEPTKSGGTATYAVMNGWDVCAKTGTTDGDTDRWFCEFTNEYAAACWYGFDQNAEIRYSGNPSNPAGGICTAVMKQIHAGKTPSRFVRPDNIVEVTICKDSGLKPGTSCKNIGKEIFVKGKEPQAYCSAAALTTTVKICKDSGLLAVEGACTNVEEKTFRSNETVPTEYCTLHTKPTEAPKPSESPKPTTTTKPSPTPTVTPSPSPTTTGGGDDPKPSPKPEG